MSGPVWQLQGHCGWQMCDVEVHDVLNTCIEEGEVADGSSMWAADIDHKCVRRASGNRSVVYVGEARYRYSTVAMTTTGLRVLGGRVIPTGTPRKLRCVCVCL